MTELERLERQWNALPLDERHKPAEPTMLQVWQNAVYAMLDDAREALNHQEWMVLRSILLKRLDQQERNAA